MNGLIALFIAGGFLGLAVVALQVGDAIGAMIDVRRVRDDDEPDALTRTRFRELTSTLALTATLAVLVAFGVDAAARLVGDGQGAAGLWLLLGCAAVAFTVGMIGVVAVLRRERPTYARLRRDLRDRSTAPLEADELAGFEERLDRADAVRERRPVAATALRIVGLLVVLAIGVPFVVVYCAAGSVAGAVLIASLVLLEIVAFVAAIRAAAVRHDLVEAVLDRQRADVVALLERAKIPQRGRVPGLRDRVARALAILREKQR